MGKPPQAARQKVVEANRTSTKITTQGKESSSLRGSIPVFLAFVIPQLLAAASAPIQDCDEVYNYWEATHYLNHGYGFQTWEYSPVYAIRSWAYAGLHALAVAPFTTLSSHGGGKTAEFYALRILLAAFCAICETRLFHVLWRNAHPRIAKLFALIMITSAGMFHAGSAYLPSSFAMYTTMLGTAEFMDWEESNNIARGILWFATGAVLGWPFVGALVISFVLVEAAIAVQEGKIKSFGRDIVFGGIQSMWLALNQAVVDGYFYGKWLCVPLNIVLYNVFASSSKGPDIYGTEPWHFYIRNLLLNFNLFFPLALIVHPLLLFHAQRTGQPRTSSTFLRNFNLTGALNLWLLIFTLQPHKEERFMYPAYPLIAISAAFAIHHILLLFGCVTHRINLAKPLPPSLSILLVAALLLASVAISTLRTAGMVTGYSAPLRVYQPLQHIATPGDTVCLGKEWYRFPSSYFLPDGVKGKFIKSSFAGLLPGEFQDDANSEKYFSATRLIPQGMNDENKEDAGKYTDVSQCTFLVDSQFPSSSPSEHEPDYGAEIKTWQKVKCERFLDAGSTPLIGRLIWTPDVSWLPPSFKRRWGEYCLLKRKTS